MVTALLLLFGGIALCAGMALLTDSLASKMFRTHPSEDEFASLDRPAAALGLTLSSPKKLAT